MKLKEITCSGCLNKSKITDYTINPYTGCSHGCVYCYADFMKRFQNIKDEWGDFVYAKINCSELLEKELEKAKPGHIWMASVCDCYMPEEKDYRLTRKILEVMAKSKHKSKFTMEILTKSSLVKRDFDLIKEIGIELGMSVNNTDDKIAKIIEPFASLPSERLETLKQAHDFGIKTIGFISPVMPGVTDLESVFKKLREAKVDYVWVEILNIKGSVIKKMLPLVKSKFPDKLQEFESSVENYKSFCDKIRKQAKELEKKYNLPIREIVVHGK